MAKIEQRMAAPDFWDNQEKAQATVGEMKSLGVLLKPMQQMASACDDLLAMVEMAEDDPGFEAELPGEISRLEGKLQELELQALLSGPNDARSAILTINARDGGVDANDWAEMVLRMYLQWAQKNEYETTLVERQDNPEAGISSATIIVRGPMAYGYLKGETGMHRLVRISPFNADSKRQTSFAAVDVSPEINDDIEIDLNDADIREDVYRASGAGGQHVNKTSSAIRLTHIPTGIVVQCQSQRSQHKNRATALKMLRGRLARVEEEKREVEQAEKYKDRAKIGFGSQIRNYFLHPDQRVKDARTGYYMGNFRAVMDGDLQGFFDAFLRWRVGQDIEQSG